MSIQSRAHALARVAKVKYQYALQQLRDLGPEIAKLVGETGLPLHRADLHLTYPDLDPEYRAAARDSRYVEPKRCDNCSEGYFVGHDKKGLLSFGSESFCPACVNGSGVDECPRCGREVIGVLEDVCSDCWSEVTSSD
ncbi:MAG: hypothetical protein U0414_31720 [Polyangiaceae bacterium]